MKASIVVAGLLTVSLAQALYIDDSSVVLLKRNQPQKVSDRKQEKMEAKIEKKMEKMAKKGKIVVIENKSQMKPTDKNEGNDDSYGYKEASSQNDKNDNTNANKPADAKNPSNRDDGKKDGKGGNGNKGAGEMKPKDDVSTKKDAMIVTSNDGKNPGSYDDNYDMNASNSNPAVMTSDSFPESAPGYIFMIVSFLLFV